MSDSPFCPECKSYDIKLVKRGQSRKGIGYSWLYECRKCKKQFVYDETPPGMHGSQDTNRGMVGRPFKGLTDAVSNSLNKSDRRIIRKLS